MQVKQAYVGMGSGARLMAPEAFGVFMTKYVFSYFSWYLLISFYDYLYV